MLQKSETDVEGEAWVDRGGWRLRLSPSQAEHCTRSGAWSSITISERLDALVEANAKHILIVDGGTRVSVAEVRFRAMQFCGWLIERDLKPGDVVAFQLPNWHEAVVVNLACAYGGFVCQPLVPIFRESELAFMLVNARSRVLLVPATFRGYDYLSLATRVRAVCPDLEHLVVVRGDSRGVVSFTEAAPGGTRLPTLSLPPPDPNAVKLLLYTSGTTGTPKGVLHTHNTIDAEVRNFSNHLRLNGGDVILMPSTVGHITGYLYGMEMPILLGARTVFMDTWSASRAAALIDEESVTFTIGATPFIAELADFAKSNHRSLPSLRYFPTGGAPVPPSVIRLAETTFARCISFRVYGSTEAPTITMGDLGADAREPRATSEGVVVGHEIRILDAEGNEVADGQEGEIVARGPEVCLGYANWGDNGAFDANGFFHTGDIGRMSDSGHLVITDRIKDLIIRGGENISPKEVEDVLMTLPAIKNVAVVAMPHARLGEICCAVAVLRKGAVCQLSDMTSLLASRGLAKQKWPERLVIVDRLPYTAAGKVKKNELRDLVRHDMPGTRNEETQTKR